MPRRKFNGEEAKRIWSNYTRNLINSITETEKEGLEKGYSSHEIEKLWQQKVLRRNQRNSNQQDNSEVREGETRSPRSTSSAGC